MADKNTLLVWLVVLVCLFGVANVGFTWSASSKISAGVSQSELKTAIDGIVFPEQPEFLGVDLSGIEGRLDSLELEVKEFGDEDASEEERAEGLVLLELESRDLKRAVRYALNNWYDEFEGYNCTVDDCAVKKYRHITDIVVKDLDVKMVEGEDTEATVEVDLKVYYYIDGDEDENERARLDAVFTVIGLDEDEDFVDAEVEDYTVDFLELHKVY